ncbi:MAG: PDGLE domain-containing protein [Dehalogenimonas sp.]
MSFKKWWLIGLGVALLLATVSPLASGSPDGLEKVADQQGFIGDATQSPFQIAAGYLFPGIHNETVATIVAGWLGVLVVFGAVFGIGRLIARKRT